MKDNKEMEDDSYRKILLLKEVYDVSNVIGDLYRAQDLAGVMGIYVRRHYLLIP